MFPDYEMLARAAMAEKHLLAAHWAGALCRKFVLIRFHSWFTSLMKKLGVAIFVIVVILVIGLLFGVFFRKIIPSNSSPTILSTATVLKQVQTLSQLVTVKYVMEKVVVLEDTAYAGVLGETLGNNRVIIVAHGIVKAGLDLQKVRPEDIRIDGKNVSIKLPLPTITDVYLDDKQTRVVERSTGFLRSFDKNLEQKARQQAVGDIALSAKGAGILRDADERARAQLSNLFQQIGYTNVQFR
jgi:hypothetical protein